MALTVPAGSAGYRGFACSFDCSAASCYNAGNETCAMRSFYRAGSAGRVSRKTHTSQERRTVLHFIFKIPLLPAVEYSVCWKCAGSVDGEASPASHSVSTLLRFQQGRDNHKGSSDSIGLLGHSFILFSASCLELGFRFVESKRILLSKQEVMFASIEDAKMYCEASNITIIVRWTNVSSVHKFFCSSSLVSAASQIVYDCLSLGFSLIVKISVPLKCRANLFGWRHYMWSAMSSAYSMHFLLGWVI